MVRTWRERTLSDVPVNAQLTHAETIPHIESSGVIASIFMAHHPVANSCPVPPSNFLYHCCQTVYRLHVLQVLISFPGCTIAPLARPPDQPRLDTCFSRPEVIPDCSALPELPGETTHAFSSSPTMMIPSPASSPHDLHAA